MSWLGNTGQQQVNNREAENKEHLWQRQRPSSTVHMSQSVCTPVWISMAIQAHPQSLEARTLAASLILVDSIQSLIANQLR